MKNPGVILELIVESGKQDIYSLVQRQCMQELLRQCHGFCQEFRQENVVGSKMHFQKMDNKSRRQLDQGNLLKGIDNKTIRA